jgi:hypothetical protein
MTQYAGVGAGVRGGKLDHRFCEHCGASLGADASFCGACGHTVAGAAPDPDAVQPAPDASGSPPPSPPPTQAVPPVSPQAAVPVTGADSGPPGAPTPWFRRRGLLAGLGAAGLVVIIAVVLIIVLSGGSSGPSQAQINAQNARKQQAAASAAHVAAVRQATDALSALDNAWGTETTAHNTLTAQEGFVVSSHNLAAARPILQGEATALTTLINAVEQINFPTGAQPDGRAFLTAANSDLGALQAAFSDPNAADFNAKIDAINQANTALNGAHTLLRSDLESAANS